MRQIDPQDELCRLCGYQTEKRDLEGMHDAELTTREQGEARVLAVSGMRMGKRQESTRLSAMHKLSGA